MPTIRESMDAALGQVLDKLVEQGRAEMLDAINKTALAPENVQQVNAMMRHNVGVAEELARDAASHTNCEHCDAGHLYCVGPNASGWLMHANRSQMISLASVLLVAHGKTLIERAAERLLVKEAEATANQQAQGAC